MRSSRRILAALLVVGLSACRRPTPAPLPPTAKPPASTTEPRVETSVSDVATGGSWQEGGQSGVYRIVVRGGGRRSLRSEVVLQWLKWDDRSEQPIEVRSAVVRELSRGGVIVTASRLDQEDGRAVAKLSIANAVTGVAGEARVWPQALGRYRAKIKWKGERE